MATGVVNTLTYGDPEAVYNSAGTAVSGLSWTATAKLASAPSTTAPLALTEIGSTGAYVPSFTPTAAGLWFLQYSAPVDGVTAYFSQSVTVKTAAKDDPAAAITALYGALLANLDAAVSSRATVAAITAALSGVSVTLVSPLSVDGGRLTLVQGDSYAAAQSRQLTWALTGQPDLTTAVVTLTIVSGTTLAKTSATVTNPASGSPTIAFVLTAAETAAFTPAKVGTFDLSATIGSDEITLARGRVYVEADV